MATFCKCDKCGHSRASGPHYRSDYRGERLVYRCYNCGYSWSEPTKDSKVNQFGGTDLSDYKLAAGLTNVDLTAKTLP